ncbi:MAG TPA: hypothetical protein VNQ56_07855 [Pseudolabrys sp.]|nr:hypothetical protein [Pseudolabrys sp.]
MQEDDRGLDDSGRCDVLKERSGAVFDRYNCILREHVVSGIDKQPPGRCLYRVVGAGIGIGWQVMLPSVDASRAISVKWLERYG